MQKFNFMLVIFFVVFMGFGQLYAADDDVIETDDDAEIDDADIVEECSLDDEWMTADESWESWSYLKAIGEIADYGGAYVEAILIDGKIMDGMSFICKKNCKLWTNEGSLLADNFRGSMGCLWLRSDHSAHLCGRVFSEKSHFWDYLCVA